MKEVEMNGYIKYNQFENEGMQGIDGSCPEQAYAIANPYQLNLLAKRINGSEAAGWNTKFYKLVADINLAVGPICGNENIMGGEAKSWTPIGYSYSNRFQGDFDGNGFSIKGLYIDDSKESIGLFGFIQNATVKNLMVSGEVISMASGSVCAGGIIGEASDSDIAGCCFEGCVQSNNAFSAGIVGRVQGKSLIAGCHNAGAIKGNSLVAGITALTDGDIGIAGCSNTGGLTSISSDCGGIVTTANSATFVNGCYSTGNMKGNTMGAIIAYASRNAASGKIIISWCKFIRGKDKTPNDVLGDGASLIYGNEKDMADTNQLNNSIRDLNNGIIDWNTNHPDRPCNYWFREALPVIAQG